MKRCEALFEDAMGHRSYARSMQAALLEDRSVRVGWHPVAYDAPSFLPRSDRFFPLHVAANARSVLSTIDLGSTDCLLLHTHWVAVGATGCSVPYVVSTDATPTAYRAADSRLAPSTKSTWRSRPLELAVRRSLRRARLVVALSAWTAQQLMDDDQVDEAKIRVVPPGVDTGMFAPLPRDSERVRIVFVGYDFERKGGQLLLEWASKTRAKNWEMQIVSPLAPASLPPGVVASRNARTAAAIAEVLGRSDVLVLPTAQDIVPVTIVEALAAGCTVVSTSVGAIPELLAHGAAGVVVAPAASATLGHVLDELVADSERRREIGHAGRLRAISAYSIERTSAAMRAVLLEASN